jgi:anaerobic magnesium-protoporphyrin IX monomethyl ester cyclase
MGLLEGKTKRSLRPANVVGIPSHIEAPLPLGLGKRVLVVDLNNFASFPTLAIGLLVSALRRDGHDVRVLCPLAFDVPATERERRERWPDHFARRINLAGAKWLRTPRSIAVVARRWWAERPHATVVSEITRAIRSAPDVILLSAYLQHFRTVKIVGQLAGRQNIPVLVGGPMFNIAPTADKWRSLTGVTAIVGAEHDLDIGKLVRAVCEKEDLRQFPGITLPNGDATPAAPPLRRLDDTPMADFTDFPWDRYRVRIVPIMTGRGCQWSECSFCSDVVSVSGRSFRTRSVASVLLEVQEQARRHSTTNFMFLDLKLNSDPNMIRGIASQIQAFVQGAEWIGTVHVDRRLDNGLCRKDLFRAVAGGMRRISFGLETGSQRLLDAMKKGASVEQNSEFIRNAFDAGLSIRCTMFAGFPGETAEDLEQTAEFIEAHSKYIDRVRFNRFSIQLGTPIHSQLAARSQESRSIYITRRLNEYARVEYWSQAGEQTLYRKVKFRVLKAVYEINRKEVRPSARQFDGLM